MVAQWVLAMLGVEGEYLPRNWAPPCAAGQHRSLDGYPMPPRTTQYSYRPRVSNRIMVGSFSKANTSACVASRTEGVEPPSQHETKWRQSIQLPWSCSRSDTARRQPSEQSTSGWMQAKQPPLSGEQGRIFILTSPLIGFLGGLHSCRACLRFTNQASILQNGLDGRKIFTAVDS